MPLKFPTGSLLKVVESVLWRRLTDKLTKSSWVPGSISLLNEQPLITIGNFLLLMEKVNGPNLPLWTRSVRILSTMGPLVSPATISIALVPPSTLALTRLCIPPLFPPRRSI